MSADPKLLITHWGTIVYEDKTGQLRHGPFFDVPHNVWLCEDHLSRPSSNNPEQKIVIVAVNKPNLAGLSQNGFFYSAERDGQISLAKEKLGSWERFELLNGRQIAEKFDLGNDAGPDNSEFINDASNTMFAPDFQIRTPLIRQSRSCLTSKHIHQIFISNFSSNSALADEVTENISHLKNINPGWSHSLWTKKEIFDAIHQWYGYELLEQYLKINPNYSAARADFFRYLCIYKLGGAYLDLKSGTTTAFDEILNVDDQFLLSHWNQAQNSVYPGFGQHRELSHISGGEFQQWHVIGTSGHPFLERVILDVLHNIRHYNKKTFGVGKMGTLRVTGPIAYTLAIHKVLDLSPYRKIDSFGSGLVYKMFNSRVQTFMPHYSSLDEDIII
jgi:inositol phosphorylceramide mannosyltransferase catalytic subunit